MRRYKEYNQGQVMLLPPSLEEKIPEKHISRMINKVVDELDIRDIERSYSELGCRAYHPRMLLKVLLYGYSIGVRSSRKIASRLQEDVVFMWLSGMQEPDFRTISDFRKAKITEVKKIFQQVLGICVELGMVRCGKVSIDGTKIEADSSRNKMSYRKVLEKRKVNYEEQIDKILQEAEENDRLEDELYGDKDGVSLDRVYSDEEIKKAIKKSEQRRKSLEREKEKVEAKKEDVEGKLARMGNDRNSFGTIDTDATRMRIKDEYSAPGYNVQMASERQVIVGYRLSQQCNDSHELKPMIEELEKNFGCLPKNIITDKGYGTQKSYEYLKERNYVGAAVPHQYYDIDRIRLRKGTYTLSKNIEYEKLKLKMMRFLNSEEGQKLLKRRKYDIEPVFGDIKHNMGFRRLLLRGMKKANIEVGLMAIVHNIKKMRQHLDADAIAINIKRCFGNFYEAVVLEIKIFFCDRLPQNMVLLTTK